MYNSILVASLLPPRCLLVASLLPPRCLLVTFHSSAKSTPGCSQEHFFAHAASLEPPWSLLVTFRSSAKSTPGCSQEHYLSTWPSQSTPWALLESSSKFLASSWGFLRCLHSSAKKYSWLQPGALFEHMGPTWGQWTLMGVT